MDRDFAESEARRGRLGFLPISLEAITVRNPKELARQLDEVLSEQIPPPPPPPKPVRIPPPAMKVVPVRNWRPIDTAPTNGTPVLITDGFVIEVGRNLGDGEGWCSQDGLESWDGELTYWMPLPDLPIMQSR